MKQEYKELLLKDLCARLPYGLMIEGYKLPCIKLDADWYRFMVTHPEYKIRRPYLRPMSSMTEEEKHTLQDLASDFADKWMHECYTPEERWKATCDYHSKCVDYMNSIHLDHHFLIEKELALEAPEDMYN